MTKPRLADWLDESAWPRLRKVWTDFQRTLDAPPDARRRRRLERLRAQMPPGGLSWPWWTFVLSAERTAQEVTTIPSLDVTTAAQSSREAA
jgi:hypothetical protein